MPHFVIDCSAPIITQQTPETIIQKLYDTAEASKLFAPGDIKVRINPFIHYTVGNTKNDFIHVFANIMEGRTSTQKSTLSKSIVTTLKSMFPDVPIISINIRDFEKATYCNKQMINDF